MVSAFDSGSRGSVRALAGDIVVMCCWARHFTLTVPLSTQVYKWVLANLMLGVTQRWTSIPSRGSRITPSRFDSCYSYWDKLRPDRPLDSYANFTLLYNSMQRWVEFKFVKWNLVNSAFPFQIIDLNGIADKIEILSEEAADLRREHLSDDQVLRH